MHIPRIMRITGITSFQRPVAITLWIKDLMIHIVPDVPALEQIGSAATSAGPDLAGQFRITSK